jgi:hypothetical protein
MGISIALNECEQIEEQIEKFENDEKQLKIAYRIFSLDMIGSKESQNIKKVFNSFFLIEIKSILYI